MTDLRATRSCQGHDALRKVAEGLQARFAAAAGLLEEAAADVLAYRHLHSAVFSQLQNA